MNKKYAIDLSEDARGRLQDLTREAKASARMLNRARILLMANDGLPDATIARTLHVGVSTAIRTRRRFRREGLEAALRERPRPGGRPRLNADQQAQLVRLARGAPPEGKSRWTLRLLSEWMVESRVVPAISSETVRRVLKKASIERP